MRKLHISIANIIFILHCFVALFIFTGWLFPQIKFYYFCFLIIWILTWIFLGYCPITKWEFTLRNKYDKNINPEAEIIKYYIYKLFKIEIPSKVIFISGIVAFISLIILTIIKK